MELDRSFVSENCVDCPVAKGCLRRVEDRVLDADSAERRLSAEQTIHGRKQEEFQLQQQEDARPLLDEDGNPIGTAAGQRFRVDQVESYGSQSVPPYRSASIGKLLLVGAKRIHTLKENVKNAGYRVAIAKNDYQLTTLNCPGPEDYRLFGRIPLVRCHSNLMRGLRRYRRPSK